MPYLMRNIIPLNIFDSIKNYILSQCKIGIRGYKYTRGNEDSISGQFFSRLSQVEPHFDGNYTWQIEYNQSTSGGVNSFERRTGADGVFQIIFHDGTRYYRKGLLFQAKKNGSTQNLREQVRSMERIKENCSAYIDYSEGSFTAKDGKKYLESGKNEKINLCEYLVNNFMGCNVGALDMYYDFDEQRLMVDDTIIYTRPPKEVTTVNISNTANRRWR